MMMIMIMIMYASPEAPDFTYLTNGLGTRSPQTRVQYTFFNSSRTMYFHYASGYDPRDLVAQFRQEKKVAKDIGLTQRRHFLGLMENLVCHFHGISSVDESITPTGAAMYVNELDKDEDVQRGP